MNEIVLAKGNHQTREQGMCAMEFVAWVANESHTDQPRCVCPYLATFFICLNDGLSDERRQILKPYLGRCIGTANDGREQDRLALFSGWAESQTGAIAGDRTADLADEEIKARLERLLPTEELPEVTEAIREKVGAAS